MTSYAEPWLDFRLFPDFKLVRQAETSECGLACLAMVANHHGLRIDAATLRRDHEISARGATARDLAAIADRLELSSRIVRCELEDLTRLRLPAILHWNLGHFVVLYKVRGQRLYIADPSVGRHSLKLSQASPHFSGVAIELTPTPRFERKQAEKPLSIAKLVRPTPALSMSFVQAFVLSLMLQAALLSVPFYMQLVIDEGLQKGDADILILLLTAVLCVTAFAAAASLLRGFATQFMTQAIAFDMMSALFQHLVRLPLSFFQKRQIGDLQQRFRALGPIQQALGSGAVTALIDGLLSVAAAGLMIAYSVKLTLVVMVFVVLSVLLRLGSIGANRNAAGVALAADAREQTRFLETLRTITTIKVNGVESEREDVWRSNAAASVNSQIRRGNITLVTQALNQAITGVSDAVVIFLGARMALNGELTVGVLTAFLAYKQQFAARIGALIDQAIVFALLDVQLERVADIALAPREDNIDVEANPRTPPLTGEIEFRNVSFRYSQFDPYVLENVNLHIEAGEFVAITGRSGGGKSTLLRLLVGLSQPTTGLVLMDGQLLTSLAPRTIRQQTSFVMQDDQVFSGTLLDNITLFAPDPDMARVHQAAEAAAIADDIASLPMGYASLLGDIGSLLSGGQKQRLLIARALYRQPRILIMDEGTSHLDLERESAINGALRELNITRIVVAHRPETIRAADRILVLSDRTLKSVG